MFRILRAGEQRAGGDSPLRSDGVDREFLNNWVCQQFGGQLGDPSLPGGGGGGGGVVGGVGNLHLEPLALADSDNLGETQPVARAGDSFPLRVMDLGLQHDVDNYLGHAAQRTRTRHLTWQEERRVLSQRSKKSDDRPLTCRRAALSR
jgi:hypothetical protein